MRCLTHIVNTTTANVLPTQRGQGISSHAVDLFLVQYPSPSTRRDTIVLNVYASAILRTYIYATSLA